MLTHLFRNKLRGVFVAVLAAVAVFSCGAFLALVIAPRQELAWRRIDRLPRLDAAAYKALPAETEAAVTGVLRDNRTFAPYNLAAYKIEKWQVSRNAGGNGTPATPQGKWVTVDLQIPELALVVGEGVIKTAPAGNVIWGGDLREFTEPGRGEYRAVYNGESLADGTRVIRGFTNGDLVTVVGRKVSTGQLYPERLYAGAREQLVDDIRTGARGALMVGVGMMGCSPVVFGLALLAALFGRAKH